MPISGFFRYYLLLHRSSSPPHDEFQWAVRVSTRRTYRPNRRRLRVWRPYTFEATSRTVTRVLSAATEMPVLAYGCDGIAANIQLKENFSFSSPGRP